MTGRERTLLAGGHGLDHVQRLTCAALTHDDAVGAHVQHIAQQVADGDLALALEVGRTCLQRDHVTLAQLQLGSVLDSDDALLLGDERGEHVEGRGLAGARSAGEEDVEPGHDAGLEEIEHLRGRGAEADEVVDSEAGGELSDRDDGSDQRERLDDGVDARAVGQAGVDARAGLVDVPAQRRDDAVDDVEDVLVVAESGGRLLDASGALDIDAVRAIDHDLGDGVVGEERLDGAEAGDLVDDALDQALTLIACESEVLLSDVVPDELVDLAGQLAAYTLRVGKVDPRSQRIGDGLLETAANLPEVLFPGRESFRRDRTRSLAPQAHRRSAGHGRMRRLRARHRCGIPSTSRLYTFEQRHVFPSRPARPGQQARSIRLSPAPEFR